MYPLLTSRISERVSINALTANEIVYTYDLLRLAGSNCVLTFVGRKVLINTISQEKTVAWEATWEPVQ